MITSIDLSALDAPTASENNGKPLEILLTDIFEDPNNPRSEFSDASLKEMAESIVMKGRVISPISVKPHPDYPGKYLLNHGARRFRGSKLAGRETIPAFIDDTHDEYDQVIENLHRDELSPMEIGLFIKKRVNAGEMQRDIAKRLHKSDAFVSMHLQLTDMPSDIKAVYESGVCRSPQTLNSLFSVYKKDKASAIDLIQKGVEITRASVEALAKSLPNKNPKNKLQTPKEPDTDKSLEKTNTATSVNSDLGQTIEPITNVSPLPDIEQEPGNDDWLSDDLDLDIGDLEVVEPPQYARSLGKIYVFVKCVDSKGMVSGYWGEVSVQHNKADIERVINHGGRIEKLPIDRDLLSF